MISKLRKFEKRIVGLMLLLLLTELLAPLSAYALTSGPSQPEVESFEPVNTTTMVDPPSGDFNYNIPLLDVGGYPVNISYHSGITMDQEASWVGLGWNINPGVINRSMRGLPDDNDGDEIEKQFNIKKNYTVGVNAGMGIELATVGLGINPSSGIFYNNYKGIGFEAGISFGYKIPTGANSSKTSVGINLGLQLNSQEGSSVSGGMSISQSVEEKGNQSTNVGANIGLSYNSRVGLSQVSIGTSVSQTKGKMKPKKPATAGEKATKLEAAKGESSLGSASASCSISFLSTEINPTITMPMENFSFSAKIKVGGLISTVGLSGDISGHYSEQKLKYRQEHLKSYGYLYMQNAHNDDRALLDFSREKDIPFRLPNKKSGDEGSPITGIPSFDFDMLSVNGQGIGGQYRLKRGDIGCVYDHLVNNTSRAGAFNGDVGVGNIVDFGVDVSGNSSETTVSQWKAENTMYGRTQFRDYDNTLFEPAYFINNGEKTITDPVFENGIGDDVRAYHVDLSRGLPFVHKMYPKLVDKYGAKKAFNAINKKANRDKRNQVVSYLTAAEAQVAAVDKEIVFYPRNQIFIDRCGTQLAGENRVNYAQGKKHHISEVEVLGTDGKRYIYGIPAYNKTQTDYTFNVNHPASPPASGILAPGQYTPQQASVDNNVGKDNYFQSQTIPAFAHSYMLTSVLSSDYHDLTNNGVSADDLGDGVKINYYKAHDNFKWRTPYSGVNYQEGYKGIPEDDKANFVYGEKQIMYVHSIESKTMVALFHMSARKDGLGVKTRIEGGQSLADTLQRLDSISLYAKSDLIKYGAQAAIPLKRVHFEYDNSLCPGTPNSTAPNQGKLTLKRIYFTYQKNSKGKLNPYVFDYNQANNHSYNIKKQDRWGHYKDNTTLTAGMPGIGVPESEFPYTPQDRTIADNNIKSWALEKIHLPSGGQISVELEADDYSYVQDKRSTQMFEVLGMGRTNSPLLGEIKKNTFYDDNQMSPKHNRYLYVKVNSPINSTNTKQEINQKYLDGIERIYYRFAIKMHADDPESSAEYVPGYVKVKDYGLCGNATTNDVIWLELEPTNVCNTCNQQANPIMVDAMQFLRLNQPSKAFPGSEPGSDSPKAVIEALLGMVMDLQNLLTGFTRTGMTRGYCRYAVMPRSWVRLNCPQKTKLGGGCRVKQIMVSDEWNTMKSSELSASYGQKYNYTMVENGNVISSGVASYEPQIGQDENPLRSPLIYKQTSRLAPTTNMFIEYPICENQYPTPDVVYRKVRIESINNASVSVAKGIGYTENQYYTAYDFPVKTDYTPLVSKKNILISKTPSFWSIFKAPSKKEFWVSQGYSIELNDMHGKPKSVTTYDNKGNVMSSNVYYYKVKNSAVPHMQLDNKVDVLMNDGYLKQLEVGKDVETMYDSRQHQTINRSLNVAINCDINYWPPFLIIPIITGLPFFGLDQIRYRSLSMTKVIHRYGLIDHVEARQEGSFVDTKNLVYDGETGEVLLTRTNNEFNDAIYNLTYPAHWAYDGMAGAYKNVGGVFRNVNFKSGKIVSPPIEQYFAPGDEIYVEAADQSSPTPNKMIWATMPSSVGSSTTGMVFIDENGKPINGTYRQMKITRSGRRNLGTNPIGSITSMVNPLRGGELVIDTATHIINTSFSEYSQFWKTNCENVPSKDCQNCPPPDCACLRNILEQVIGAHHVAAQASDSVFVDMCCLPPCKLDSCSCKPVLECSRRHYYADPNQMLKSADYYATIGNCKLHIVRDNGTRPGATPLYGAVNVTTLKLPTSNAFLGAGECDSVCEYYKRTGWYPLVGSIKNQNGTFTYLNYYARIECDNICKQTCKNLAVGGTINPYRFGILGDWRPYKTWVYKGVRMPGSIDVNGNTNIRKDGYYATYNDFWVRNAQTRKVTKTPYLSHYIDATTITKYNTKGAEIENRDAAGIYTSATFGYLNTLATAIAKNARYKQIAYDGFEDYDYRTECTNNPCVMPHFWFQRCIKDYPNNCSIDTTVSHSGFRSIKVTGPINSVKYDLKSDYDEVPGVDFSSDTTYHLRQEGCIPKFSPDSGKYVISAWVKEDGSCGQLEDTLSKVYICYDGSMDFAEFKAKGNKVEGWQRIEGVFTVPSSATAIKIQLIPALGKTVHYDDIRIHPFHSNLKSYAYDNRSLRLMAELDENNYATFYEYDDEGGLVRVKKETERGVMTIKETRSALKK